MNSQEGGQSGNGILVNSWTTTDAGNCYQIIEAGEFKEEDTDGISHSELNNRDAATIYDLQGRSVIGIPTHGVYIVNGKKVVIK